jgi:pimeloyl-ACP methyl ester carboxylesterase
MAFFLLVHGSMHGGWCWQQLVPELRARGHRTAAPDLPCEEAAAGLAEYAAAAEEAIPEDVDAQELVLVGHSLGSRTIPVLADRHPGARLVFLCSAPTPLDAVDPSDFAGMVTPEYAQARFEVRPDGAQRVDREVARTLFYHDCDPGVAEWAAQQLRWQGGKPLAEPSPIRRWPTGPMHMIVGAEDRVARCEWLLAQAASWPGLETPVVLEGGHSPMLARPAALADALVACAETAL